MCGIYESFIVVGVTFFEISKNKSLCKISHYTVIGGCMDVLYDLL